MCGIFGYLGTETPNLDKFKILGIYNQERGTESAGIIFNQTLKKTSNFKNSVFKNFINTEMIRDYKKSNRNFLMGHVRKASSGYINIKTAQPFTYVLKDKLKYVFCHNGTLKDWKDDAKKDFPKTDFCSDSEMLGNYLADKKYEILKTYEGNAAFAGYDYFDEKLILFRGSHKLNGNQFIDERPMFILKTKNGIWYSSLEDSLQAIAEENEKPEKIDANTVYEIDKNKNIKTTKIERTYNEVTTSFKNSYVPPKNSYASPKKYTNPPIHKNHNRVGKVNNYFYNDVLSTGQPNMFKGHMYYYKGRYCRNGKFLNGVHRVDGSGAMYPGAPERIFYHGWMAKQSYNFSYHEFREIVRDILQKVSTGTVKALNISDYAEGPVKLLKEDISIYQHSDLCINGRVMKPEDFPYRPLGVREIEIEGTDVNNIHVKKYKQDKIDVLENLSIYYWKQFNFNDESWWKTLDQEEFHFYAGKEHDCKNTKTFEDDELLDCFYELNSSVYEMKNMIENDSNYVHLHTELEILEESEEFKMLSEKLFEKFDIEVM